MIGLDDFAVVITTNDIPIFVLLRRCCKFTALDAHNTFWVFVWHICILAQTTLEVVVIGILSCRHFAVSLSEIKGIGVKRLSGVVSLFVILINCQKQFLRGLEVKYQKQKKVI